MQTPTLPNFEISIFEKIWIPENYEMGTLNLAKIQNRHLQTSNSISILNFSAENLVLEISKSDLPNSSRISFRVSKIRIQRYRKPPNLDFPFKTQFFLRPKSSFCINQAGLRRQALQRAVWISRFQRLLVTIGACRFLHVGGPHLIQLLNELKIAAAAITTHLVEEKIDEQHF